MNGRNQTSDDMGKLVLRLTLAILLLSHGVSKITGGIGQITEMVTAAGLPQAFAYGAYVGEVVAPVLLLIGLWTRLAALLVVINMAVAVALVHTGQILTLGDAGGWALELQGFYLFTALAIALLGAGRYSIGGSNGRWN
jgi:putative oxidoreductase